MARHGITAELAQGDGRVVEPLSGWCYTCHVPTQGIATSQAHFDFVAATIHRAVGGFRSKRKQSVSGRSANHVDHDNSL
jgi:protein-disulfide isomerase-like protein with CxxC motif